MSPEKDLLRVVLSLRMGFIREEQVRECGKALDPAGADGLTGLLQEKGFLAPKIRAGLDLIVDALAEDTTRDWNRLLATLLPGEEDRRSLAGLFPDDSPPHRMLSEPGGIQSRKTAPPPAFAGFSEENLLFMQLALRKGIIGTETLARCARIAQDQPGQPIGLLFLRENLCSREAFAELAGLLDSKILHCRACGSFHKVENTRANPACRSCGSPLCLFELMDAEEEDGDASPSNDLIRSEKVYRLGSEIGRGGLGRILKAEDTVLRREVAVKEMIEGTVDGLLLERFLREGEVAGRLLHPNVVPVFDVGVRDKGGTKIPYFAMGRIIGRDLQEIIQALETGRFPPRQDSQAEPEDPRRVFTLTRLLQIFQDVCLAISYAHDHGVIHRDLKPANVMVGNYGEVFVVDWGLAKMLGDSNGDEGREEAGERLEEADPPFEPALTIEGQVMGTPAYMPPEQAQGRMGEVDEQSDIYSLGAILYEILTFRPPFEGDSYLSIVSKARTGTITPPTVRFSEVRSEAIAHRGEQIPLFAEVAPPPELEAICLRAMARDKSARYAAVMELHEEVQQFLEGVKEKERNHRKALENIRRGNDQVRTLKELRAVLTEREEACTSAEFSIKAHWPVEKKKELWDLQQRVKDLRLEISRLFGDAATSFQEALGFERDNPDARAALADLYWDQYLREELAENHEQMTYFDGLVRKHNDGRYDDLLRGDGTLAVASGAYPCPCLVRGRSVALAELEGRSCHPYSGRAPDGRKGAEGLPELEPATPPHLKVHGPNCRTREEAGAHVWLFEYEEKGRILLPVFPRNVQDSGQGPASVPDEVLARVYEPESPYRPAEGLYLGRTPVPAFPIPMGSYLLILHKEGFLPVRCPVYIARCVDESVDVTLFRDEEIPPGFVQVPAGKFVFQGDQGNPHTGPREIRETGDFFMARFPVTCAEYLAFLNELVVNDPEQAERRAPRLAQSSRLRWPRGEDGRFVVPTKSWLSRARLRPEETPPPFEEDWPVLGVSWQDAMAYCAWKRRSGGFLYSLPDESDWEKTARGPDGRVYAWGNELDPTFCNMGRSREQKPGPASIRSFPLDESPYGVRGLGGNASDPCLNDPNHPHDNRDNFLGFRLHRGGTWAEQSFFQRASFRFVSTLNAVNLQRGIRLFAFCSVP